MIRRNLYYYGDKDALQIVYIIIIIIIIRSAGYKLSRTTIILIMNALHFYNGDRQLEIVFSKFQVQKNKR